MINLFLLKRIIMNNIKDMSTGASTSTVGALVFVGWLCPILMGLFLLIVSKECVKAIRKFYLSRERYHLEQFGGPKAFPIFGTVADMLFTDFYDWSEKMFKRWGDPLRLWRFSHPMIFISSYKYAIQLLSKSNFNGKLQDLDMIRRQPGGAGLSTTPAAFHSQKRKMLQPAFSRKMIESSFPIFCEETAKLVEKLEVFVNNGQEFNVVDFVMCSMFQMVARSDFGDTSANVSLCNNSEATRHMTSLHTIAKNLSSRILSPQLWHRNDFIYFNLTKEGIETKEAISVINSFATRALNKRKEHLKSLQRKSLNKDGITNSTNCQHSCYLDFLLELVGKGHMTENDVVSELNNFMGGAYDTTALTVCWTLLLLALHPQHQKLCYEEVYAIISKSNTLQSQAYQIAPSQIKEMQYLELCLKESLRLFPPAPIFPRSTVDDIQLDDGRVIPKGVDVLIFANLIHRDPVHFPQPEAFIPERHLEGSAKAYMPFSLGVRNCIGQVYGMSQAKVVLAMLIFGYKWHAPLNVNKMQDVKVSYQGLLYPAEGIHLKISKRSSKENFEQ